MAGGDKQAGLRAEPDALFGPSPPPTKKKRARAMFTGMQGCAPLAALNAWWPRAARGDEFVYCEALEPIRNDETWHRAGALARAGFLRTHARRRAGGGKQYFAVRTAKLLTPRQDPVEAALADPASDIIYRALKRAANFAQPCPSDEALRKLAGLNTRDQAQHRFRKLIDVGLIESTLAYEGGVPRRVVTILATRHAGAAGGKSTALPRKYAAMRQAERELRTADDADMRRLREARL